MCFEHGKHIRHFIGLFERAIMNEFLCYNLSCRCSFMNFARNMRCLECNGARPKRVLTGGEWECPQ